MADTPTPLAVGLRIVCVCSVWAPCVALPSDGGSSAGSSPLCGSPVDRVLPCRVPVSRGICSSSCLSLALTLSQSYPFPVAFLFGRLLQRVGCVCVYIYIYRVNPRCRVIGSRRTEHEGRIFDRSYAGACKPAGDITRVDA